MSESALEMAKRVWAVASDELRSRDERVAEARALLEKIREQLRRMGLEGKR